MSDPEQDRDRGPGPEPRDTPQGAPEAPRAPEPGAERKALPPAPPARLTGRDVLWAGLWPPRVTRSQLIVAALLFVLGLGLAIQVRAASAEDSALRGARPEDLVRILSDLEDRSGRLEDERNDLEEQRTDLETSSDQAEEARRQTAERERQLGILAGTVAAEGPGIELRVTDPAGGVRADMLLDAVQELRAAGAEAIQINDVRVVAGTFFTDENGQVRIDGRAVNAPYVIDAIGRPQDLEPALNIPGGVVQSLEKEQAGVTVERPETVLVDALRSADRPDYAQSSP